MEPKWWKGGGQLSYGIVVTLVVVGFVVACGVFPGLGGMATWPSTALGTVEVLELQ